MGQLTNSAEPAKKRYRVTQWVGNLSEPDSVVTTLEGQCPFCISGEHSLIVLHTKPISLTSNKYYFYCMECNSEGTILLNI